jgi:Sec-independent protein secretion pathway component TatC
LSRSEAEYVAMCEAVKEIRFVCYLLVSLGISVKLPIIVITDNIGAIITKEILTQEFVSDILIPGTISFVRMWRVVLLKLFL